MEASCRSVVETEQLSLTWDVEGFEFLRQLARLNLLPSKDRLSSQEFGNAKAGFWKVELFPYGFGGRYVSLSLCCTKKSSRIADCIAVIEDKDGGCMHGALGASAPRLFNGEKKRLEFDEFLLLKNESHLKHYMVDGHCLRLKITVKVYCGVFEDESPRGIVHIVQRRCLIDDSSDDDDGGDDSALPADDNDDQVADPSVLTHPDSPVNSTFTVRERSPSVSFNFSGINDGSAVVSNAVSTVDANQSTVSSRELPLSGSASDASLSSWPSLPSGVETTKDKSSPHCNLPGRSMQTEVSMFAVDPRTYDMTIICEGRKFRCSRFLLGVRSEVFKAMFYGEFAEPKMSEIEINDIPADCVEEFLTFLMTDTCSSLLLPYRCRCESCKRSEGATPDESTEADTPSGSEASTHADGSNTENGISTRRVCSGNESCRYVRGKDAFYVIPRLFNLLAAADKYQVLELSSKCLQALARCIYYRTVLHVLRKAETSQCNSLIDACWFYIKNCNKVKRIVKEFRHFRRNLLVTKQTSPSP